MLSRWNLLAGLILAACTPPTPPATRPEPVPVEPAATGFRPEPAVPRARVPIASRLPEVPLVEGPLAIRVVYPAAGQVVGGGDSSFVFGSVGTGRASLSISGQPVRVWPNGAWLAWIRLPSDSLTSLDLMATAGSDTVRLRHPVRRPVRYDPPLVGAWVDTSAMWPRGDLWFPAGEPVTLHLRAVPGAAVRLLLPDGTSLPMVPAPAPATRRAGLDAFDRDPSRHTPPPDHARYGASFAARPLGAHPGPLLPGRPAPVGQDSPGLVVEAVVRGDTARVHWPLRLATLPPAGVPVRLDDDPDGTGQTDRIVVARPAPGATYHWFFPNGTRAVATGRAGGSLRLEIATGREAWVAAEEAIAEPAILRPERARVGSISPAVTDQGVLFRIPVSDVVPYRVVEDARRLTLVIYRAAADIDWVRYGATGDVVDGIRWDQSTADVVTIAFDLHQSVWGYRTRWSAGDLVLEIRRPPAIDRRHPLRGRLIVVDAGHPPAGATGPTGLTEAEANLGVALELQRLLEDAGAQVVMTRTDGAPVGLWPRVEQAERVGGEVLVSVHNNALPDGVDPFANSGTSVFYNHPRSRPLARLVQEALVDRLGLRDLGHARADLALVRPTWMPAILTEGLFMMVPDQEHALRTEEGRRRYAEAVRDGLEDFLRLHAEAGHE